METREGIPTRRAEIIFWLLAILVSINISVVGYTILSLLNLERRVTIIEANRWTSKDGARVFQAISEINEKLASLPKEYPPQWLQEIVKRHDRRIERLESKVK